jgi:hypothetical protein
MPEENSRMHLKYPRKVNVYKRFISTRMTLDCSRCQDKNTKENIPLASRLWAFLV